MDMTSHKAIKYFKGLYVYYRYVAKGTKEGFEEYLIRKLDLSDGTGPKIKTRLALLDKLWTEELPSNEIILDVLEVNLMVYINIVEDYYSLYSALRLALSNAIAKNYPTAYSLFSMISDYGIAAVFVALANSADVAYTAHKLGLVYGRSTRLNRYIDN